MSRESDFVKFLHWLDGRRGCTKRQDRTTFWCPCQCRGYKNHVRTNGEEICGRCRHERSDHLIITSDRHMNIKNAK